MKRIIKWKILLSLCCIWLAVVDTKAQLTNESFESWCGTVITNGFGNCPTFANACVPGWRRSHGSPQIATSGAPDGNNYVAMWGSSGWGEGIVAPHTFTAGKKYRVCLWVRNDVNNGQLIIRATTGVPVISDATVNCSDNFPGGSFENMHNVPLSWNTGWTRITFDYTASGNYTQLIIFPTCNTQNGVVWLNVDDIDIAEICVPSMVFNMTTNTVSGTIQGALYDHVEYIEAGSSAGGAPVGSGTVITAPNAIVTFEAGTLVVIKPNFNSAPNAGLFHVYIHPCTYTSCAGSSTFIEGTEGTTGNPDEPYQDVSPPDGRISNRDDGLYAGAEVYPNPTTGILRVTTQYDAEATYELTNITGQVVQKGKIWNNETLDISEYPSGIYFLKITEGVTSHQSTHKIVKE